MFKLEVAKLVAAVGPVTACPDRKMLMASHPYTKPFDLCKTFYFQTHLQSKPDKNLNQCRTVSIIESH